MTTTTNNIHAYHRFISVLLSRGAVMVEAPQNHAVDFYYGCPRTRQGVFNGSDYLGSVPLSYYRSYQWLGGDK
jgi:hypothetical protein